MAWSIGEFPSEADWSAAVEHRGQRIERDEQDRCPPRRAPQLRLQRGSLNDFAMECDPNDSSSQRAQQSQTDETA